MKILFVTLLLGACAGELTAEGTEHQYVVSEVRFPSSAAEASTIALPLKAESIERRNGFGGAIAGVVPLEAITDVAIDEGRLSQLITFQTRSFGNAIASGVTLHQGAFPDPAACLSETVCSQHLQGTGSFSAISDGDQLFGTTSGNTFLSVLGPNTIQLSFDGLTEIEIPLLVSRIQLQSISEGAIGAGIIAGAIPLSFMTGVLSPWIQQELGFLVARDCQPSGTNCVCELGSPAALVVNAIDTDRDCILSPLELGSSTAIQNMTVEDIKVDGIPAITFGMGFQAINASF